MDFREGSQSPPMLTAFCAGTGAASPQLLRAIIGGWAVGEDVYKLSRCYKPALGPFPSEYADVVGTFVCECVFAVGRGWE